MRARTPPGTAPAASDESPCRRDPRRVRRPIVFIHGAFGSGSDFATWVDFFGRAGFACHAPSLPGHDPPDAATLRTLRIADYVASMQALAQNLPHTPILVGHSMGGLVAQHVAATVPC